MAETPNNEEKQPDMSAKFLLAPVLIATLALVLGYFVQQWHANQEPEFKNATLYLSLIHI